jgi:hypothetical protein
MVSPNYLSIFFQATRYHALRHIFDTPRAALIAYTHMHGTLAHACALAMHMHINTRYNTVLSCSIPMIIL